MERSLSIAIANNGLEVHNLICDDTSCSTRTGTTGRISRWIWLLIAEIEAGRYPYRRVGHPWDITTEGRRLAPWVPRLAWRAASSVLPSLWTRRRST